MRVTQQHVASGLFLDAQVPIHGCLLKKHTTSHSGIFTKQWGKRYVVVNIYRGTLSIGKSRTDPAPSTILPLCDISVVKELPGDFDDWSDSGFTIHCPPLQLTLRAVNSDDRVRWVNAICSSVALWQDREKLTHSARKSGVPLGIRVQHVQHVDAGLET
mmetsp:Transcript_1325/g.2846  ORF Transcript_1325/g.2846 Transcript_1325/m.2846 type:complete len:159 (+) Transcript_1325:121-597(+)